VKFILNPVFMTSTKKYLAELIGTFALVLFGCGAAVVSGNTIPEAVLSHAPAGLGILGIALAFGLAVVAMCYAIGPISGCLINPAITIAMFIAKKISNKDALGYIIAQLIGATICAVTLYAFQKGEPNFEKGEHALGSNGWGPGYLGAILAAILWHTVFETKNDRNMI